MTALDPRIEAIRKEYDLRQEDFWQIPQNKQWVCKHAALEVVAAKAGIVFEAPQILEARSGEGVAAVCVRGHLGERSIWSIGEASPKNSKNSYPWAMAEKRAVDRVVLKLVGIHGLVYSDNEVDASSDAPVISEPKRISSALATKLFNTAAFVKGIEEAKDYKACDRIQDLLEGDLAFLPNTWTKEFSELLNNRRDELTKQDAAAVTANASLDRQYAETMENG